MPKQSDDELKNILMRFSEWTIKNTTRGIWIPLRSPKTENAIKELFAIESAVFSDKTHSTGDDELGKILKAVYNHAQPDKGYDDAGELSVPEARIAIHRYAQKMVVEELKDLYPTARGLPTIDITDSLRLANLESKIFIRIAAIEKEIKNHEQ